MNREEAIEQLQKCKDLIKQNGHEHLDERDFPLLDIAIEALKGAEINCVHCPRYFETEDETGVHSHCEDLISRAEAIETIEIVDWYHQNSNKDMVHGANDDEHQAWYKAQDIYEALESLPSADRPRGEWIEETSWKYKRGGRNSDMKEVFGTEWMTMIRQRCSECNKVTMVDGSILYNYCPHCGADMRGGTE